MTRPIAVAAEKVREPNRLSGSIGWARVCSMSTNATPAAAASPNPPRTKGSAKPRWPPATIAWVICTLVRPGHYRAVRRA